MKKYKTDVLVIGAGGAGLRAAIELHDIGIDVIVVGKSRHRDAHTVLAAGGINAALGTVDTEDNWKVHAADTVREGQHIGNAKIIETACRNAADAVLELVRWGAKFNRNEDGELIQRFFGAQTYRRTCFAGDETGKEIIRVLTEQAIKRKIKHLDNIYVTRLLAKGKQVNGIFGIDLLDGNSIVVNAKAVILATGGYSRVYRRSTSRAWENTGDGIMLAYDAGAELQDMEMVQFHPTGMVWPSKMEGVLVTEAVRGEGGRLYNTKGERFMKRYDAKRMELSARDIVARANYFEIMHGRGGKHGGVLLDVSHRKLSYLKERLPKMVRQFKQFGVDISKKPMEVAPTAHYSMGGVRFDADSYFTNVPGLFVIGEVTAGLHGANRLGGNSLMEIMVFGKLVAREVEKFAEKVKLRQLDKKQIKEEAKRIEFLLKKRGRENPIKIKKEIQEMMWEHAGVLRDEKGLRKGLEGLIRIKNRIKHMKIKGRRKGNKKLIAALEVEGMVVVCEAILRGALLRKESRGAHYRTDYKKKGAKWKKNIVIKNVKGEMKLFTVDVMPLTKDLRVELQKEFKAGYHLLE